MPDTKPGLILDEEGVCQACRNLETKKKTDYKKRFKELEQLCDKYRRKDGYYDCLIAVSGGKDSYFQTKIFKEDLGMNPLLVTAGAPFSNTKAGEHNLRNMIETFNCDLFRFDFSPKLVRKMMRLAFEGFGSPTWPVDRALYSVPIITAIRMKTPLVIYGENVSWEYGGVGSKETYSAKEQINNDVAKKVDFSLWYENGITDKELNMIKYPTKEEIENAKLDPIYLSYFIEWDGYSNYEVAKKYGFKDLSGEWEREGYIENYDQIDSVAYLINVWMKYPKFGFARATDTVGYWIRGGRITREEGRKLIEEHDHKLDRRILEDFLKFAGYTEKEFWQIVEKFWNTEFFEKVEDKWKIKEGRFGDKQQSSVCCKKSIC